MSSDDESQASHTTMSDTISGAASEWKFYGAKHGWQLKVTMNRRALIYLIPRSGNFTAAVALREPAIAALRASKQFARQIRDTEQAPASPEGKPVRIVVTSARQTGPIKALVQVKLESLQSS